MDNKDYRTLEEFASDLARILEERIRDDYVTSVEANVSSFTRTNGETMGINVRFDDTNVSPTVYPEEAYKRYLDGESIDVIVTELSSTVYQAYQNSPQIPEFTLEEARRSITLTLVNTERNGQMLENTPHFEVGDLSAVPRWYISEDASFVVHNDMAANLKLTPEEILQIGQANIDAQTFDVTPMSEILREMLVNDGMDPELVDMMMPLGNDEPMLVMSSQSRVHGANALLSEKALNEAYEKLGEYIVLPSSIHEVICVPANSNMSEADLRAMVREVNMTEVSPRDFLSDNIMKYDGQKLSLVVGNLTVDAQAFSGQDVDSMMHFASMGA